MFGRLLLDFEAEAEAGYQMTVLIRENICAILLDILDIGLDQRFSWKVSAFAVCVPFDIGEENALFHAKAL